MAREIERKFLVADDSWRETVSRSARMSQGYIAKGAASVRIRIVGDAANLNIKAAKLGTTRDEYEYAIPLADAREMLERLAGDLVDKTRHWVDHDGSAWEIDEFHGRNAGLVVAELELESEGEAFTSPPWLGAEVTHLARYYNASLAAHPFDDWTDADRADRGR